MGRSCLGRWRGDMRQPCIESRDGVVELAGNAVVARLRGWRHPLDLPGNRIKALVNVGDVLRFTRGHRRSCGWLGVQSGIEPFVKRHASAPGCCFRPFTNRWFDAVFTPRYARIHAVVRCSPPGAALAPLAAPHPHLIDKANSTRTARFWHRLFRVTVNNGLRNADPATETLATGGLTCGCAGVSRRRSHRDRRCRIR